MRHQTPCPERNDFDAWKPLPAEERAPTRFIISVCLIVFNPAMPRSDEKPTFLLLRARIPALEPGQILGRFVTHPSRPLDNSCPKNPSSIIGNCIVKVEEASTVDVVKSTQNDGAHAALKGLLDLAAHVEVNDTTILRSKYVKTYRLENHYKAFDKLEINPLVREDLDGPKGLFTRSKGKLYMIIGYKSFSPGTAVTTVHHKANGLHGSFTVPLSMLASGFPLDVADPKIGAGLDKSHRQFHQATIKDEEIFAIEYKIVTQRNMFGAYSAKAETMVAHNPMTHDWSNSVYDVEKQGGKIRGKFDDDSGDERIKFQVQPTLWWIADLIWWMTRYHHLIRTEKSFGRWSKSAYLQDTRRTYIKGIAVFLSFRST